MKQIQQIFQLALPILICLFVSNQAAGGHLVGGEIYYECLGDNRYVITLKMYRDCNGDGAPFDPQVQIGLFKGIDNSSVDVLTIPFSGDVEILPFNQNIPCLADTPNICISTTSYIDTFTLEVPLGGLSLSHQRCCRPPNVVNIQNVEDIGSTYYAFIPDSTVAPCNSSPSYNEIPPIALCANLNMNLDYSATDKDGDSLVYAFCRPYHGGTPNNPAPLPSPPPYQTVPWELGFNDQHQITALPQVKIDSSTAKITGRPTELGTYAFGVCVQEWRDGVFISENKRDFQLTTAYCEVDAVAAIDSALEACIGFDIQYFNQSTLGESFYWDFGDSTVNNDTSTSKNPSYTYPDTGVYQVTLIAFGKVCSDTTTFDYRVQHKIEPNFAPPSPDCLDRHRYRFEPSGHYRETTMMKWEFENDSAEITDDRLPVAIKKYDAPGEYTVTLRFNDDVLGCYKKVTKKVVVWPNPDMELMQPADAQCAPFTHDYSVKITDAHKPSFLWYFDSTLISESDTAFVHTKAIGSHDLSIIMTTDSMCIDTVSLNFPRHITVLDTPIAGISASNLTANMYTPEFTVYDSSTGAISWQFFLEQNFIGRADSHFLTLPDTGNYLVAQVAEHRSGCFDTAMLKLRVIPEYLTFIPNAFTPNGSNLNEVWKPSVFVHSAYLLTIYDRWGNVIFKSENPNEGWNGTVHNSGKICPHGVYTYDIYVEDEAERPYNYSGPIYLIK